MLDSPRFTATSADPGSIAVRRDPPIVEDLRSTTVTDDPVQRRDLILIERARGGDLEAFNDLVRLYQDQLFALVVRMVPDRDQASDAVQEASSRPTGTSTASGAGACARGSTASA
jgi:hypothetical protein